MNKFLLKLNKKLYTKIKQLVLDIKQNVKKNQISKSNVLTIKTCFFFEKNIYMKH